MFAVQGNVKKQNWNWLSLFQSFLWKSYLWSNYFEISVVTEDASKLVVLMHL